MINLVVNYVHAYGSALLSQLRVRSNLSRRIRLVWPDSGQRDPAMALFQSQKFTCSLLHLLTQLCTCQGINMR